MMVMKLRMKEHVLSCARHDVWCELGILLGWQAISSSNLCTKKRENGKESKESKETMRTRGLVM
jgi:hypothetical protein